MPNAMPASTRSWATCNSSSVQSTFCTLMELTRPQTLSIDLSCLAIAARLVRGWTRGEPNRNCPGSRGTGAIEGSASSCRLEQRLDRLARCGLGLLKQVLGRPRRQVHHFLGLFGCLHGELLHELALDLADLGQRLGGGQLLGGG